MLQMKGVVFVNAPLRNSGVYHGGSVESSKYGGKVEELSLDVLYGAIRTQENY